MFFFLSEVNFNTKLLVTLFFFEPGLYSYIMNSFCTHRIFWLLDGTVAARACVTSNYNTIHYAVMLFGY